MAPQDPVDHDNAVSLAVRAVYDDERQAVGVDAIASEAFDLGDHPQAMLECLAAITARANCIAASVIGRFEGTDDQKKQLFDHFASLKEHMLNDMLRDMDRSESAAP
jgi:hypothetical protein